MPWHVRRWGDFVYFDPPYHPISPTSRFTAYHAKEFSLEDQIRLAVLSRQLRERGVHVMVSNSYTAEIRELYHDFYCETIEAARVINSRGDRRRGIPEMIITGYNREPGSP
jgi:Site-specific DNA methylase